MNGMSARDTSKSFLKMPQFNNDYDNVAVQKDKNLIKINLGSLNMLK